jgi:flagellar basal-body rod protein FlgF
MQNALLVGLSRQVVFARELDVVANNVANLNTAGFKSNGAVFEEFISKTAREGKLSRRDSQVSFVRDRATYMNMAQGSIERTGNTLDVAIDGKGYIAVQTPGGERFTRNGAFQLNAAGELVTSEGFQVLGASGPIKMQPKDRDIKISADGTISVREGDNVNTEAQRGKLRLVSFDNPSLLKKEGASTFSVPANVTQTADANSHFVQGSIERSNVNGVLEMTRMIEVTRSYNHVATLLQQQADLQRTAVEKLGDVPN